MSKLSPLRRNAFILIVFVSLVAFSVQGQTPPQTIPTYYKDVQPILQKHCLSCHHKGGTAPQSFETYAEMRPWIRSTKKVVNDKSMPPWKADSEIGKWRNGGRLTEAEIKTISSWVETKATEGDAKDAPAPMDYSKPWTLGKPDKEIATEEFSIPSQGGDLYNLGLLDPGFTADTWVEGIELRPGEIDAVQQMSLSIVPASMEKSKLESCFDLIQAEMGKPGVAFWNRGMSLIEKFPGGTGILIPKGSKLALINHYKTNGAEMKDRSKVALHFAKGAPPKELITKTVQNLKPEIPAEAMEQNVTAELKLDKGVKIYSILPQMHYLGTKLELIAHQLDGKDEKLLKIDGYSYDLQTLYAPAEPISLPAGAKLEAIASYQNSRENANNPNMTVRKATYGTAPEGETLSVVLQLTEE